jgi:tetratricopeptide (TPR) repeat protein
VRRGDYDEAERQYLASLAKQPRQHRVHGALGTLALRRGDLDAAERRLHEALELAPSYVEAMSNLGWVEAARGDEAGAQRWYERAIAADPAYPHVACLRALDRDPQSALVLLGQAVDLGFGGTKLLETNEDFDSLRAVPGWRELTARATQVARANQR